MRPSDLDALDFVIDVFLPEARARGIAVPSVPEVRPLLDELAVEARRGGRPGPPLPAPPFTGPTWASPRPQQYPPAPAPSAGSATPAALPVAGFPLPQGPLPHGPLPQGPLPLARLMEGPLPPQGPPRGPRPAPSAPPWSPPPVPRPTPVRDWWGRVRGAIGSDLGVHGLAYLGVLLLFVGVFGLVAFAFGEVTPSLRPVAELSVAVVPFLGARLLIGNGAAVVGRALEVVGGLLLPIMGITSLVDGYAVPPNPTGAGLVVGLSGVCVASACADAWWSRGHRATGLRYAAAPSLWLAAAMAAIGVGRSMPSGQDVAVPSSAQGAAMAAALVATLLAARWRPADPLAEATRVAAVPGIVVVALLAAVSWSADGAPPAPVALAGVLLLVALELLRPRVPAGLADVAGPLWLGVVALVVGAAPAVDSGLAASGAAVGFGLLVELAARRDAPAWAVALPATGLGVALLAAWPASWLTVGTLVLVTAWAVVRRSVPFGVAGAAAAFDGAAAVLPVVVVVAVASVTTVGWGIAAAGVLVLLATVPAVGGVLGRGAGDGFWVRWWRWAAAVVAVVAANAWVDLPLAGRWAAIGTLVGLGAAAVVGPVARAARPWVVTGLAATAWVLGCATVGAPVPLRGVVLGAVALAMVVASGRARASLGLAGHAMALITLGLAGPGWGVAGTVGLATAAWAVTAARAERDRSAVASTLTAADAGMRFLPWSCVALGVPVTVGLALDAGDVLTWADPWFVLVPAVTAVGYALVARAITAERPRAVAAAAAFAAALIGAGLVGAGLVGTAVVTRPWPAVVALAALVAATALTPADRRRPPMVWTAWLAVAPLAGLVADQLWAGFAGLPPTTASACAGVAVGAVLVVAGTAVRGNRLRGDLGADQGVGMLDLGVCLVVAVLAVPQPAAGRLVLAIAAVLLVLAVLARAGGLAGVALTGAWFAVVTLAWAGLGRSPWVSVLVTGVLLVVAQALHRLVPDRGTWTRWDLPVLIAAAPVGCTALLAAADGDAFTPTFALVGAMVVAVGVRLRARPATAELLGAVGSALVLVGAGDAGAGWLALALLVLAAAHTGLAVRAAGTERAARQVVGAVVAVAAWGVALDWLALSSQACVDATAAVSAGLLLGLAGVARLRRVERSWSVVWGTAALAVLATAAVAVVVPGVAAVGASAAVTVAVGAAAAAGLLAAEPLGLTGLRDLAAGATLLAVLIGLASAGADDAAFVTVLSALGVLAAGGGALLAGGAPVTAGAPPTGAPRAGGARRLTRATFDLGAGAAVAALLVGISELPDVALLVPAVAACAVQCGAVGVALRAAPLQVAAPVLACVAWLLAVVRPGRAPEWYTVAVGLTVLVVVGVWRRELRRRGTSPAAPEVVVLEVAGIMFLVVAPLVRAVTTSPAHAAVAVGIGVAVAAWGVATRVRRRLAAGVTIVGIAVVLLVVVPLARLLPAWGGPAGWIMLAGVGLVAVLAATLIERGRTAARATVGRLGELTAGWE